MANFHAGFYNFMTEKRIYLSLFLGNNLHMLEYSRLADALRAIYWEKNICPIDLMVGINSYQHNARMAFSMFPTSNVFRIIVKVMNLLSISILEDVGTGIGLVPYIFKKFNACILERNSMCTELRMHSLRPLETITAIDPIYQLQSSILLDGVHVKQKDLCEYIVDDSDKSIVDKCYLFIDPPYLTRDYNMCVTIAKFCKIRRPRLVIIIGGKLNFSTVDLAGYKQFICHPKVITKEDSVSYNYGRNTHYVMMILTRNDISVDLNIGMFGDDVLSNVTEYGIDLFHIMYEKKKVPVCVSHMDAQKATSIMEKMHSLRINELPLFLEKIDDIDTYLNFYQTALTCTNGLIPDTIQKKENFLILRGYMDRVFVDLEEMKKEGIIPRQLQEQDVLDFLIVDYCYSDKIDTNIFSNYVDSRI